MMHDLLPSTRHLKIAVLLLAVMPAAVAVGADERPNFLFILVDDQSPLDLQIYNADSPLESPNIDRLAREGMVFDGAHHMGSFSGAVCTPSRHMIMTGRTVWHLPIGPGKETCPENIVDSSMGAVFNRAGYDTMRTCKAGNTYRAANKQFSVRHEKDRRDPAGSDWHAEHVLRYLDQRGTSDDQDPFLIFMGFSHPHDPRNGKDELLRKYGAVNHDDPNHAPPSALATADAPELPETYLPAHPFHHGHPGLRDEVNVPGVWKNRDEATVRNELGREYACSENIDIQIGRVLDKLEALGELDRTYVFYTSDHGIAIGRHGLMGKQNLYEHTWRVPYIVRGPGIAPGSRALGNIYLLDTLQSMCDLAGIDAPRSAEGASFKPVLEGKTEQVRDVLYGAYCGGTKPGMRCVKRGPWKLIKYDVLDGDVRETQLFNLDDNPREFIEQHQAPDVTALTGLRPEPDQVDLAENPDFAQKLAEMEALLLAEQDRLDDPYRLWDQPTN